MGLFTALQAAFTAEVARLSTLAAGSLATGDGPGLAVLELAVRTAMAKLGAALLEDLLATPAGHRGPRIDCEAGHQAEFISYRAKTIDTLLGCSYRCQAAQRAAPVSWCGCCAVSQAA